MKRITLLILLLIAAAGLLLLAYSPDPEERSNTLESWDMREEIQKASDTERNPWK